MRRYRRQKSRRAKATLREMSLRVTDQSTLNRLLEATSPAERYEMVQMIAEYLPFKPQEISPDCPTCGRYRGLIVPHSCSAVFTCSVPSNPARDA